MCAATLNKLDIQQIKSQGWFQGYNLAKDNNISIISRSIKMFKKLTSQTSSRQQHSKNGYLYLSYNLTE